MIRFPSSPFPRVFAALVAFVGGACENPAGPVPCGALPEVAVNVGERLSVAACFTDENGDVLSYTARSSSPAVAEVSISDTSITVTGVARGNATVTVTATDPGGIQGVQDFAVAVLPVPMRLTNNGGPDQDPDWSPDGTRIAFASYRYHDWRVYVMDADGSDIERLTNNGGADMRPVWSPDGTMIAFYSDRGGGHGWGIYVMDMDGSDVRRLSETAHMPRWSPDGTRIAFASYRDWPIVDIYVMDVDGGNLQRLTKHSSRDDSPVWSPDGTRMAFMSDRDGDWNIYVIEIE